MRTSDVERAWYFALPLTGGAAIRSPRITRCGVPFVEAALPLHLGGSAQVNVGVQVNRIYLLGMTEADLVPSPAQLQDVTHRSLSSVRRPSTPVRAWSDPRDTSLRFFVGDQLGRIKLCYADRSTEVFPLVLGQGLWWGRPFFDYPDPYSTSAVLRHALADSLRLCPCTPVADGNYVAVINPKRGVLQSIIVENAPAKKGTVVITGVTVESDKGVNVPGAARLNFSDASPTFDVLARMRPLCPVGQEDPRDGHRLHALRRALYSFNGGYEHPVAAATPPGYSGPKVAFDGTVYATILANAFRFNVQDIADKIDADGMYHTSTKSALSWGGYRGFGTFRLNVGRYYDASFSRDLGRSLQELTAVGYTADATRCADYCLRQARLYATDPKLRLRGVQLPPHWSQIINKPTKDSFENDGQGLIILFLYKLWQQLPNRAHWLRHRWVDIKASGDWILWQFTHPEVSGAANGLLHTTGEAAHGGGYSVYADCLCMDALRALARMANSIGEKASAAEWRKRANKMQRAITKRYIVTDERFGTVWTLAFAGWPYQSSVLGPLILQPDYRGFAPEDGDSRWGGVNAATYQRLVATYRPFGFYGQAMGYGQGFVSQAALLLDRMHDATAMLNWMAKEIYDPKYGSYIVPEGCLIDPSGRYWYRIGDLGNGVQEGEVIKTLRLVIGIDDSRPRHPKLFPRVPYGWTRIAVKKYPILCSRKDKRVRAYLDYNLIRTGSDILLSIHADHDIGPVTVRLGPFASRPIARNVRANGRVPAKCSVEHSGDSWWVRFTLHVRPANSGKTTTST